MLFFGKKEKNFAIVECSSAKLFSGVKLPYQIGNSTDCDLNIQSNKLKLQVKLKFSLSKGDLVCATLGAGKILLDSVPLKEPKEISPNALHSLQLEGFFFLFYYGETASTAIPSINLNSWGLVDIENNKMLESGLKFNEIETYVRENLSSIDGIGAFPKGVSEGFWVENMIENFVPREKESATLDLDNNREEISHILDEECGELSCPSCWLKFNAEDVNFIAVHENLRGDPLLGEDEQLRFVPTKYNAKGLPLDPMGVPVHAMACPHCHRRLPSTFLQMKSHIVSLVGAPSSGKSYFLSILLHFFPAVLYKYYNMAFIDADPPLNAVINAMKNKLFAISNSQDHYLSKTQLEGEMYDRLVRHGKKVSLPKPFVYILRDMKDFANQASVTFYDNAGEHFEPGISIEDSPGSLHVAAADILMFLFDPLVSTNIKLRLNSSVDPQLLNNSIDQQDVILAEMANRIKQIKNTENAYDLNIPFAFVVNKCDAIESLFNADELLENPLCENGDLDYDIIDSNSEKIKAFLLEYAPNVVINAEMVSKNVKYFMMSPFGHTPKEYIKEDMSKYIMPDPALINPKYMEMPLIWAFSNVSTFPLYKSLNKDSVNSRYIF